MSYSFWDFFALDPASYSLAIGIFTRLIGVMYLVTYIPFLYQWRGLYGKNGIRPIGVFLEFIQRRFGNWWRFYYVPTLWWINSSDRAISGLIWAGIVLGAMLTMGICPPLVLFFLYLIHLSLTAAGQDFMGFGWETFLMETSIGLMLMTATTPYNLFGWLSLNFLLFRFYIQAGASKIISRDKTWHNLTALYYHYFSQPLPNTTAWYVQKWPMWFHKLSAFSMFFIELVVPFAMFSPPEVRFIVFFLIGGLQVSIWLTGNFSYLNHLTFSVCLLLIPNLYLEPILGPPSLPGPHSALWWQILVSILGFTFLAIQVICCLSMFFRVPFFQKVMDAIRSFHLAYPHGIFAIMTTKRIEMVIEGSNDGMNWKEYEFFYKPGDLSHRPRRISPYQPRIDWQMWFLPFGQYKDQGWLHQFLIRIFNGVPEVLALIKKNPFPKAPPLYLRVVAYNYTYTSYEERQATGHWWKRELLGLYAPQMHLNKSSNAS